MRLARFLGRYVLAPLGVLLQVFGYIESLYRFTGIPYTFFIMSTGFAISAVLLIWYIWFSGLVQTARKAATAVISLVIVSTLYYAFLQYSLVLKVKKDILDVMVAFDSVRDLIPKDPHEALIKISKLMEQLGELPDLVNARATANYRLGRYKEALEDYRRAAALDPKNRIYEFNVAVALREMCAFKEARGVLDEYLRVNKDDMWGYFQRGVIQHVLGNYDPALSDYNIVIANDGPIGEAALFNSAVVYALKFKNESSEDVREAHVAKIIEYLERSIVLGQEARKGRIRNALIQTC
jgi:tetratricopeptide (TPR) repeat protein